MKDRISEKVREFTAELSESYPLLLKRYPLHLYDKEIKSYTEYYSFIFLSPALIKIFDGIKEQYNARAVVLYHKLSLSTFILDTLEKLDSQNVPDRIIALYHKWFERVYRDFSAQTDSYYHHENDSFRKDIAVCRQKALPVGGAWIVELSHVSTKYLLINVLPYFNKKANTPFIMKGLRMRVWSLLSWLHLDNRIVPILTLILERLGVYRSCYLIHTVDRYLPRFTEEQMNQAYLNIAELLKNQKNVCGIYRQSWFLDPNLKDISPELSFLWKVPQQNGAKLFCTGTTDEAIKKAIVMSMLRKKLYEEGEYRPMTYAYFWPREELLQWASEQSSF